MKQKIQTLTIFMLILNLFGCSSDMELVGDKKINSEKLVLIHQDVEFVKKNKTLWKKILNTEELKKSNVSNKILQTNDFKIFTNRVTYTSPIDKSRESYSFYIEKNTPLKPNFIDNLIFSKSVNDNDYKVYIITYFFPDGVNNNNNNFKVISFKELDNQSLLTKKMSSKMACDTYVIVETGHNCGSGEHNGAAEEGLCKEDSKPYSTYAISVLSGCGGGGGGSNPSEGGNPGSSNPGSSNPGTGNTIPVDTGITLPPSCQTNDCPDDLLFVNEINDLLGKSLNYSQLEWLAENTTDAHKMKNHLNQNNSFINKEFYVNIINYLMQNSHLNFDNIVYNRTSFDTSSSSDLDNNSNGGFDNTSYNTFNPQQQGWPTIQNVISANQFVGWGTPGIKRNCMDYAKAQIGKVGYQISNYGANGQTFQIYTEQNGVNSSNLSAGLSYLKYALSNSIPVIVGVDDNPGNPGNPDNTTDHFIVIIGMGSNSKGNYFKFYDNASGNYLQGTSPLNQLYYNSNTGLISGSSECSSYFNSVSHNYIITHIRKSKIK